MTEEKLRLHITPFSTDLAQSLLSTYSSLAADSISYHTLETLPENSYGYIELLAMEAERLKKKLNGSILKGKRLRIEHARPQKRGLKPEEDKHDSVLPVEQESRLSKKSKQSKSELQGHELTPGRKVKRGWTEPEKGKRWSAAKPGTSHPVPSKHTDERGCLFRVQLPPNKETDRSGLTKNDKDRGAKKAKKVTVVHEFEKSVKQPSFIRKETGTGDTGVAAEYVDGKGWIDKDGNVLEDEGKRKLRSTSRTTESQAPDKLLNSTLSRTAHLSSSSEKSSGSDIDQDRRRQKNATTTTGGEKVSTGNRNSTTEIDEEDTSSSGTSGSDSESSLESDEELEPEEDGEHLGNLEIASEATPTPSAALHPLEALFKRPNQAASQIHPKRPLEIKTTFSFFEPDEENRMPQTPFTTHDLQVRGQRSAAPTPDTAHPTRRFFAESVSPGSKTGADDIVDLGEGSSNGALPAEESKQKEEESEFAKWFWEHRGENNRAWKRRRRETMKENRQRENRQKGRRIV